VQVHITFLLPRFFTPSDLAGHFIPPDVHHIQACELESDSGTNLPRPLLPKNGSCGVLYGSEAGIDGSVLGVEPSVRGIPVEGGRGWVDVWEPDRGCEVGVVEEE
jgi:hypothetical protein